jgi:hypothetical protein
VRDGLVAGDAQAPLERRSGAGAHRLRRMGSRQRTRSRRGGPPARVVSTHVFSRHPLERRGAFSI